MVEELLISKNKTSLYAIRTANTYMYMSHTFKNRTGSDGKTYKNKASVKNLCTGEDDANKVITLTANRTPNSYTVKFAANGGKGKMKNESMTYGKSKALTANSFKKAGSVFKGWSNMPEGEVMFTNKY